MYLCSAKDKKDRLKMRNRLVIVALLLVLILVSCATKAPCGC